MVKKYPQQGEVWWVNLDPTIGKEISKKRPCLIVSPDDMNAHLGTVIAAPITSTLPRAAPALAGALSRPAPAALPPSAAPAVESSATQPLRAANHNPATVNKTTRPATPSQADFVKKHSDAANKAERN